MEVNKNEKRKGILYQRLQTNNYNKIIIDLDDWYEDLYPITYNPETLKIICKI